MKAQAGSVPGTDMDWLLAVLWPDESLVRVRANGPPEDGFRRVGTFAVLPNARRPRLLVPMTSRRTARAAFRQFNEGMTQRARLTKALAGVALAVGGRRLLVGDRLFVAVAETLSDVELGSLLPERHLAEVLGCPGIAAAVTFGSLRPNRKPVLQAIAPDGSVPAYAKVAWNELTLLLVRNEATSLRRLARTPPRTFAVPRLIHHGPWGAREMTVISAFEHHVRRRGPLSAAPPAAVIREIAELSGVARMPIAEAPMWRDLQERILSSGAGARDRSAELAARFERDFGGLEVDVGTWHGDCAPWNMSRAGQRLAIWDWERSRDGAPVGLDVAHFAHQVTLGRVGHDHVEAARRGGELVEPLLRELDIDAARWRATQAFYLFELFLRYEDATAQGVLTVEDPARESILSAIEWTGWAQG